MMDQRLMGEPVRLVVFQIDRRCTSTTTVADRRMGKVVGKPYWGKPDVRFDEGAGGNAEYVGTHPGA